MSWPSTLWPFIGCSNYFLCEKDVRKWMASRVTSVRYFWINTRHKIVPVSFKPELDSTRCWTTRRRLGCSCRGWPATSSPSSRPSSSSSRPIAGSRSLSSSRSPSSSRWSPTSRFRPQHPCSSRFPQHPPLSYSQRPFLIACWFRWQKALFWSTNIYKKTTNL